MLPTYFEKCLKIQEQNLYELFRVLKLYFTDIKLDKPNQTLISFFLDCTDFDSTKNEENIYTFLKGSVEIIIDETKWKHEVFFYDHSETSIVTKLKLQAKKESQDNYGVKLINASFNNNDTFSFERITFLTIYDMKKQEECFIYSSNQRKIYQFFYKIDFLGFDNNFHSNLVDSILERQSLKQKIKEKLNFIFLDDFINDTNSRDLNYKNSKKPLHYLVKNLNITDISWVSNYKSLIYRKERHKPSVFHLDENGKLSQHFYVIGIDVKNQPVKNFILENNVPVKKNFDWPEEYLELARMNNLFGED